ncbi:YDG/SRA domain-containing protein [Yinghuangia sp. YIM S09857]|uniref:YDG/SRA domain-containing protein n=1 Tax=Yinghuangia sp. YIM S09857 TaxID=3436929 RepID=UPI003F53C4C6
MARLENRSDNGFFGPIAGVHVGQMFVSRAAVREAKVHRQLQAGICGRAAEGAESIVVSGGYQDDVDHGDVIIYTGEGGRNPANGRQVADQVLTKGNAALLQSQALNLPVRVVRGHVPDVAFSPPSGYRYDGLFAVARSWSEAGRDGFLIWRYELVKLPEQDPVVGAPADTVEIGRLPLPTGNDTPGRTTRTSYRIRRDSLLAEKVKQLHDHRCQVCGLRLETPMGHKVQGAHIVPLGKPHNGPDIPENLLCLCPNHHALFDGLALEIRHDRSVWHVMNQESLGTLRLAPGHHVRDTFLAKHRDLVARRQH